MQIIEVKNHYAPGISLLKYDKLKKDDKVEKIEKNLLVHYIDDFGKERVAKILKEIKNNQVELIDVKDNIKYIYEKESIRLVKDKKVLKKYA